MVNLVIKGNSKVQEGRKGNSKRKMEKNPNLHKVSLVLNATGMQQAYTLKERMFELFEIERQGVCHDTK